MVTRLAMLGVAAGAAVLVAASTRAASAIDFTSGLTAVGGTISNLAPDDTTGPAIGTHIRNTALPEPATMMLLGTGLLAAFRARRRA